MKIFFISTPRGEGKTRENYKKIYEFLADLGYEHITDFINTTTDDFYDEMHKGRDAHIKFYNKMVECIKKADICVFEASKPSLGVGYLIQLALGFFKPTLVLYYKENVTYFISGIEDEKLIVKQYSDNNYKEVLRKSLDIAREKRDKRFNFFLSPKLLQYTSDAAKERGVTKSKLLRDLIVKHMRESD